MKNKHEVGVLDLEFRNHATVGYFICTYDEYSSQDELKLEGNRIIRELTDKLRQETGVTLINGISSAVKQPFFGGVMTNYSGYVIPHIGELKEKIVKILTTKGSLVHNGKKIAYSLNNNLGKTRKIRKMIPVAEWELKNILCLAATKVYGLK